MLCPKQQNFVRTCTLLLASGEDCRYFPMMPSDGPYISAHCSSLSRPHQLCAALPCQTTQSLIRRGRNQLYPKAGEAKEVVPAVSNVVTPASTKGWKSCTAAWPAVLSLLLSPLQDAQTLLQKPQAAWLNAGK